MNDAESHIFEDLEQLEATLAADTSGERARGFVDYFRQAETMGRQLMQQPQRSEERLLAGQLVEGLCAAQRIVRHVWEAQHEAVLAA